MPAVRSPVVVDVPSAGRADTGVTSSRRVLTLLGGTVASRRDMLIPDWLLAAGLAFSIVFATLAAHLHGSLTPLLLLLVLISVNDTLARGGVSQRNGITVATGVSYTVFIVLLSRLLVHVEGATWSVTLERVTLLIPLAGLVGWRLMTSGRILTYLSWLLAASLISVPMAIFEWVTQTALFHADIHKFVRNGHFRAVVGAEHPLVLGTLFVAMIPVAVWLLGRWGYFAGALLYLGVWTTGSNGPEIVGAVVLLLYLVPPLGRWVLRTGPIMVFLAGLAAYMVIGAEFFWSSQIRGTTTTQVSDGYRAALYHLLPSLLHDHPLGFGPHGIPPNQYYFYTVKGIVDVSNSIDSEVTYAATEFGILAIVVYVAIALVAARAAGIPQPLGVSTLAITLIGLFLAIHSWNSLGALWFVLIGACGAAVGADRNARRGTAPAGEPGNAERDAPHRVRHTPVLPYSSDKYPASNRRPNIF